MARPLMDRRTELAVRIVIAGTWLVLCPRAALAEAPPPSNSGLYVDINTGPAYATFLPIDSGGTDNEHLVTSGRQLGLGFGYGWEFSRARVDLGLRDQHLHLAVSGRYSLEVREDDFRANYDYLAPCVSASVATRLASRVNGFAGLMLGTATFFSDRQGRDLNVRQLPVFGAFEGGILIQLSDALEARAGLSWVPPVQKLNVLTPQAGLRARF
jgi:hypothetical protein